MATANPPTLQTLHYALFTDELHNLEQDDTSELEQIVYLSEMSWVVDPDSPIVDIQYSLQLELYSLITADGRAYAVKELSASNVSFRRPLAVVTLLMRLPCFRRTSIDVVPNRRPFLGSCRQSGMDNVSMAIWILLLSLRHRDLLKWRRSHTRPHVWTLMCHSLLSRSVCKSELRGISQSTIC